MKRKVFVFVCSLILVINMMYIPKKVRASVLFDTTNPYFNQIMDFCVGVGGVVFTAKMGVSALESQTFNALKDVYQQGVTVLDNGAVTIKTTVLEKTLQYISSLDKTQPIATTGYTTIDLTSLTGGDVLYFNNANVSVPTSMGSVYKVTIEQPQYLADGSFYTNNPGFRIWFNPTYTGYSQFTIKNLTTGMNVWPNLVIDQSPSVCVDDYLENKSTPTSVDTSYPALNGSDSVSLTPKTGISKDLDFGGHVSNIPTITEQNFDVNVTKTSADTGTGTGTNTGDSTGTISNGILNIPILGNILNAIQSIPTEIEKFFDLSTPIDMSPLQIAGSTFTNKFPFSLPWDLKNAFTSLGSTQTKPDFSFTFLGNKINVDLSQFQNLIIFMRAMEFFLLCLGLVFVTPKLLGGDQ